MGNFEDNLFEENLSSEIPEAVKEPIYFMTLINFLRRGCFTVIKRKVR